MNSQINIHNALSLQGTYFMPTDDAERVRELLTEAGALIDKSRGFEVALNIDIWPGAS